MISYTKAEKHIYIVSWMENQDLILSRKEWSRKKGKSKDNYLMILVN